MTPTEINIAIAEASGFTRHPVYRGGWLVPGKKPGDLQSYIPSCPNYAADLNACAEFEKTLTDKQYRRFSQELHRIWCRDNNCPLYGSGKEERSQSATAFQRSEAFLRTLNLWKETQPETPHES